MNLNDKIRKFATIYNSRITESLGKYFTVLSSRIKDITKAKNYKTLLSIIQVLDSNNITPDDYSSYVEAQFLHTTSGGGEVRNKNFLGYMKTDISLERYKKYKDSHMNNVKEVLSRKDSFLNTPYYRHMKIGLLSIHDDIIRRVKKVRYTEPGLIKRLDISTAKQWIREAMLTKLLVPNSLPLPFFALHPLYYKELPLFIEDMPTEYLLSLQKDIEYFGTQRFPQFKKQYIKNTLPKLREEKLTIIEFNENVSISIL